MLRKAVDKKLDWPSHLPFCLFSVKSTPNRSTGFSPFELLLGTNDRSPLDLLLDEVEQDVAQPVTVRVWLDELNARLDLVWDDARQRGPHERDVRKEAYDRGATPRIFPPGDKVLLRTPGMHGKLEEAWEGPYEVTETFYDVNVRICLPGRGKKNKVVHVNLIVPFVDRLAKVCRVVLVAEDDGCDLDAGKL